METLFDMFALYATNDENPVIYAIDKDDIEKLLTMNKKDSNCDLSIEAYRVKDYSIINGHLKNYSLENDEPEMVNFLNLSKFEPCNFQ